MVTMNVQVGVELDFLCVQCKVPMELKAAGNPGVMAALECPLCGARVEVMPGKPKPGIPALGKRMPQFRPAPKT